MSSLPRDANPILGMVEISRRHFPKHGICYLDLWPFGPTLILINSPALSEQATHTNTVLAAERPPVLRNYMYPIAGGPNLFDMPEKEWKPWRAVLSKAFAATHVMSLVPSIVDECLVFCDTLRRHAHERNLFFLDPTTRRLTLDFAGHLTL